MTSWSSSSVGVCVTSSSNNDVISAESSTTEMAAGGEGATAAAPSARRFRLLPSLHNVLFPGRGRHRRLSTGKQSTVAGTSAPPPPSAPGHLPPFDWTKTIALERLHAAAHKQAVYGRCDNLVTRPLGRKTFKLYPSTFSFFLYQSTVLSSHAVDGHQMYSGGSVVGKASTIGIEISPTLPIIVTGVKKCEICTRMFYVLILVRLINKLKFVVVFNITQISALPPPRLKYIEIFERWNKLLVYEWSPYVLAKFDEVGSTRPWEPLGRNAPPVKLHGVNVLNRQ